MNAPRDSSAVGVVVKYPDHPIATVFPLMTGDDYWALVDDVKTHSGSDAMVCRETLQHSSDEA